MKEPVKGVTRCEKSLLCEVQILTSLFPVISHRIVQRMARKIWLLTVVWRFSWMARKVFAGVRRFVKLIVERFQVQGSSPCSTMVPSWLILWLRYKYGFKLCKLWRTNWKWQESVPLLQNSIWFPYEDRNGTIYWFKRKDLQTWTGNDRSNNFGRLWT